MPQTPLYTSHYEIHRCLMMNYLIILGELILSDIVSVPFPELFSDCYYIRKAESSAVAALSFVTQRKLTKCPICYDF